MGDFFNNLFGGGDEDVESNVSGAETAVEEDKKKAKAIRTALYQTSGGSSGAGLLSSQTQKRDTLLGN
ncbi:MAG: hypothetical protein WC486_03730 [Candidatus Omnitrophota bacterium]|jgi:hypothetical protein